MSLTMIAIIPDSPLIIWIFPCNSPMKLSRLESFWEMILCSCVFNFSLMQLLRHGSVWIFVDGFFYLSSMLTLLFKIIRVMEVHSLEIRLNILSFHCFGIFDKVWLKCLKVVRLEKWVCPVVVEEFDVLGRFWDEGFVVMVSWFFFFPHKEHNNQFFQKILQGNLLFNNQT